MSITITITGNGSDFCISTEPTPSQFIQQNPRLFPTPDGGFIIAWEDYRLGELSYFAQRFDSCGIPSGTNFQVVGNADMAFLPDGTGMIIGTAIEGTNYVVYGQILTKQNAPIEKFIIDKQLFPNWGYYFAGLRAQLAATSDGFIFRFNFGGNINLKKFDRYGTLIFDSQNNLQLPDSAMTFSLAVNSLNQYVLLWFNARSDTLPSGIYATFFSPEDSIIAENVLIEDYSPYTFRYEFSQRKKMRAIAVSDTAFEFFWADADSMILKYVTYNSSGQALNYVNKIELALYSMRQYRKISNLTLTNIRYGIFGLLTTFIQYVKYPTMPISEYYTTLFSWFTMDGVSLEYLTSDNHLFPTIGDNLALLSPFIAGCPIEISDDIFLSRLQEFNWLDSLKVNDDIQGANQNFPKAVVRDSQSFFVSWQDANGCQGRVVDTEGNFLGEEIPLEGQEILFLPESNAVIFWEKKLNQYWKIAGLTIYNYITWQPVSIDTLIRTRLSNKIFISGLQTTDSTFVSLIHDGLQIRLYSYFFNGQKHRETILNEYVFRQPFLLPCDHKSFWILWDGNVQLYSTELKPLSSISFLRLYRPPVLYLDSGRFLKVLESGPPEGMFATVIDTNGTQLERFLIVEDRYVTNMTLALLDSTHFIAQWTKDKEIYTRIFNISGEPETDLLQIYDDVEAYRDWANVCVNNDKILIVWSDTRNWGHGYDIYGSIYELGKITSVQRNERLQNLPTEFSVAQNYPNPFNTSTTIRYDLPRSSFVRLEIYNLLGQKVRTLIDKQISAGNYNVTWDGKNDQGQSLSNGVYIYKIESNDFSTMRKALFLK